MLERRRFRHGAEAVGDEFGGVVERAKALARLHDEHAGERWAGVNGWRSSPYKGMNKTSRIYEPTRSGAPYVAAIFNPQGRIVASQAFPTWAGAERFLQAFMQEGAGEHGLTNNDAGGFA